MKVLGFRADPTGPRYAIVVNDGAAISLANADCETRLLYPASVTSPSDKAGWLYREIERVFRDHSDIARVVIKTNEYTQSDSKAKRESAYAEAMVLLYCAQHQVPVEIKIYTSLGTKSGDVKTHAEARVGRTAKYWDAKMADAVVAGWSGARA
jgi:glycosylphosphatidylinositol transamidase (GPIT) subunit GPI8